MLSGTLWLPQALADDPINQNNTFTTFNSTEQTVTVTATQSGTGGGGIQATVPLKRATKPAVPVAPKTVTPKTVASDTCHPQDPTTCRQQPTPVKTKPAKQTKPTQPDPAQLGAQAAATITVPTNNPVIGPQPAQNRWNIIPVGYPIWLWTDNTDTSITQTVTNQNITINLDATRQNTIFDMGDNNTVTCTNTTPRPLHNDPFQASPTCGYTYLTTGTYTITATTTWNVTWQTLGQTGVITLTNTTTNPPITIAELHTVITANPPQ